MTGQPIHTPARQHCRQRRRPLGPDAVVEKAQLVRRRPCEDQRRRNHMTSPKSYGSDAAGFINFKIERRITFFPGTDSL